MKTQKWNYLCDKRSAYFPIHRRLNREREKETARDRETDRKRERDVKW